MTKSCVQRENYFLFAPSARSKADDGRAAGLRKKKGRRDAGLSRVDTQRINICRR
jgi:hypothetical protein